MPEIRATSTATMKGSRNDSGLASRSSNNFEFAVQTEHGRGIVHRVGKTRHLRVAYRLLFPAKLLIPPVKEWRFESRSFNFLDKAPRSFTSCRISGSENVTLDDDSSIEVNCHAKSNA